MRPEDARRYGRVLERYASLLGRWIVARSKKELGPDDVLVVVSAHGLEPTRLWRRLVGTLTGTEVAAASHAAAPPGLLLAVGAGIQPGAGLVGASVLDVTPTLLYLLGLPVARDMDGRVLTEMLEPASARDHPVTFIPSYEGLAVTPAVRGAPSTCCRSCRRMKSERRRPPAASFTGPPRQATGSGEPEGSRDGSNRLGRTRHGIPVPAETMPVVALAWRRLVGARRQG